MKLLSSILLILISGSALADNCNYLMMSAAVMAEVDKLQKDVSKIPLVKLDPGFCEAINNCTYAPLNPKLLSEKKTQAAEFIKTYPDLIKRTEDAIKAAKGFTSTEPSEIQSNKYFIKALENRSKKLKNGLEKYQAYLKNPILKFDPALLNEGKSPMTNLEDMKYYVSLNEEYYKSLVSRIESYSKTIESYNKRIALLDPKDPKNSDTIDAFKNYIDTYQKSLIKFSEEVAAYKKFLENPKLHEMPLSGELKKTLDPSPPPPSEPIEWFGTAEDDAENDKKSLEIVKCKRAMDIYQANLNRAVTKKIGFCGLVPEEIVALSFYSDSGYRCMNSFLRKSFESKEKKIEPLIKSMNSGLEKLPNYQGLVVRGGKLPPEVKKLHTVGAIVTYDAYTSTSTSNGFDGDKFLIYSKEGKPIMGFSTHNSEYEVLFKAGSKFKILDVKNNYGVSSYIMKEVGSSNSPEEEKKADQALLEVLKTKTSSTNSSLPDHWKCPLDDKTFLPKSIPQKTKPNFK